jgi:hypothetical protein
MSTNPFRHHTNTLFASRGCDIDAAIAYANEVITAMPTEQHAHAMTALMVVVNTAANAFDQARGPSPEKLAILQLIHNEINNWASSNFEAGVEAWIDNNLDVESKVREYLDDSMDFNDKIEDYLNDNLEQKIADAIVDMDLVVRAR